MDDAGILESVVFMYSYRQLSLAGIAATPCLASLTVGVVHHERMIAAGLFLSPRGFLACSSGFLASESESRIVISDVKNNVPWQCFGPLVEISLWPLIIGEKQ